MSKLDKVPRSVQARVDRVLQASGLVHRTKREVVRRILVGFFTRELNGHQMETALHQYAQQTRHEAGRFRLRTVEKLIDLALAEMAPKQRAIDRGLVDAPQWGIPAEMEEAD